VRLLLDTHVLLWWLSDDPALGGRGRELIATPDNLIFYSAATVWEIRIKQGIGKLELPADFAEVLGGQPFEPLAVTVGHANAVLELPLIHRDPFDRMLVAQARVEKLTLLTRDPVIRQYDVPTVLA
jgi:PIN domain nuclease of toxin-antitoxin system